jgi:hypothetical protein
VNGGAETQVLESLISWCNFAIVDDGIYFMPKPSSVGSFSIQFFRFLTRDITPIATINKPWFYGLSVSPDKRRILYTQTDLGKQRLDVGGEFSLIIWGRL